MVYGINRSVVTYGEVWNDNGDKLHRRCASVRACVRAVCVRSKSWCRWWWRWWSSTTVLLLLLLTAPGGVRLGKVTMTTTRVWTRARRRRTGRPCRVTENQRYAVAARAGGRARPYKYAAYSFGGGGDGGGSAHCQGRPSTNHSPASDTDDDDAAAAAAATTRSSLTLTLRRGVGGGSMRRGQAPCVRRTRRDPRAPFQCAAPDRSKLFLISVPTNRCRPVNYGCSSFVERYYCFCK